MSTFQDCLSLASVKLGSKIKKIYSFAFSGCISLKTFDKGSAILDTIDTNAFEYTGLTSFVIDSTVTVLGDFSFYQSKLESLEFASRYTELLIPGFICKNCVNLKTVILPNSVQFNPHGSNMFESCTNLESITLPAEIKSIPEAAFSNCSNLAKVDGPGIEHIEAYAFYNCSKLSSFTFGHVLSIGEYSFSFCSSLEYLYGLSTTDNITFGSNSFSYCTTLKIEKIYSTYSINEYSFLGCSGLESIIISCTSLSEGVFTGCSSLGFVSFDYQNSPSEIGPYSFMNCTNLKTVLFGDSVKCIGYYAFAGCPLSDNLNLNKITYIGKMAFAHCQFSSLTINVDANFDVGCFFECANLESVEIGKNVEHFSLEPFVNCSKLATFICENNPNMHVSNGNLIYKDNDRLIAFPPASNIEEYTIPNEITEICSFAFAYSTKLKKIILNHFIELSENTFSCIHSLEKFEFEASGIRTNPSSVKLQSSFGDYAFSDCKLLKSVKFMSPVYSLGRYCFINCISLEDINLSTSCSMIGEFCFSGCTKLKEIDISKIDRIPNNAFQNCKNLISVKLSDQLVTIGESAFVNSGIKSISISISCMKVESYAFYGCNALTTCNFSSRVTRINSKVFYNTSLSLFKLYDTVRSIESDAFQFSDKLKIEIVNPQTNNFFVDGQALIFKPTKKLILTFGKLPQEFTIPSSVEVIGKLSINPNIIKAEELDYPLQLGTTTVIIPSSVKNVEPRAFERCQFLYNICYEGDVFQTSSVNAVKIYVTQKYPYLLAFKKDVIRTDCSNVIPDSYTEIAGLRKLTKIEVALIIISVISVFGCVVLGTLLIIPKKKSCKCEKPDSYKGIETSEI